MAMTLTKEFYKRIPIFDGNPSELVISTSKVENLFGTFCRDNNPHRIQNHLTLLEEVQLRLVGEARQCLYEQEFTTVAQLLDRLKSQFKDSRTTEQLKLNLFNTKPNPREHPFDFLKRVQQKTLILARIRVDDGHGR
uniref:Retrotransposon gag domain-containing protein n=1 Tax=Rhodnius prolixus TaxID=13249 RepID=T1HY14_RHOPR